jgi:sugar lactone lactonase YvrE
MAQTVARGGKALCGPAFDGEGRLFVCATASGRVLQVDGEELTAFAATEGAPTQVLFSHLNECVVLDQAHNAVLMVLADGSQQIVAEGYEGAPLKGPSSAVFDTSGALYFTDSGPQGETGLASPRGSVFVISPDRILRPIALECLAQPSAVALSASESAVFVAEQAQNRIIRYTQKPAGVWHGTVWHTFNGRLGPSALVADHARGLLYVSRPELPELSEHGVVSVLDGEGRLLKDLHVPGPEVSGMALSPDGNALYITESTHNTVSKIVL